MTKTERNIMIFFVGLYAVWMITILLFTAILFTPAGIELYKIITKQLESM